MTDQPQSRPDPAGVPGLLVLMATATVLATAIIAVALAAATWLGVAVALFAVAFGTFVVLFGVGRALGDRDDEFPAPRPRTVAPQPELPATGKLSIDEHARRQRSRRAPARQPTSV